MKICIASNGKDENSKICEIFGRAPFFLIFEDKKLIKTIKNPFIAGGGGAGLAAAKVMKNEKVNLVIAGKFGPNVQTAFKEAGIKFKEEQNRTIKQELENKNAKTKKI